MLSIPVPVKTGNAFLDGNGTFDLITDQDVWTALADAGLPFRKGVAKVAEVRFGPGTTRNFEFGRAGDFKLVVPLQAGALHRVEVLRGDEGTALAVRYGVAAGLAPGKLYARLQLEANAATETNAALPVGPLSPTVGITAAGAVAYERWLLRDEAMPARTILLDLYGGIRLPQHVDGPGEVPEPGELLITRFSGYLRLKATLSWGYALQGVRAIEMLEPAVDSPLRLMSDASLACRLAGDFQVEARRGTWDGWVRLVLRKSRDAETTLAADFGFEGDVRIQRLQESAEDFLAKLFGADPGRIADLFGKAKEYATIEDLDEAAGKLLKTVVHKYAGEALGMALDNSTVAPFLASMRGIAEKYKGLDRRIFDLYQLVLRDGGPGVSPTLRAITLIADCAGRQDLLRLSGLPEFAMAIDLIRLLHGNRLFEILQRDEAFAELNRLLKAARDFAKGAEQEVKKWLDLVHAEAPVSGLLDQLAKLATAEKIRTVADERLQSLAEQLTGRAFAAIRDPGNTGALADLRKSLEKIEAFRRQWCDRLKEATRQKFQARLHAAYSRARRDERLLDLEINLAAAGGPRLARLVSRCDCNDALTSCDPQAVFVRQGLFTDQLQAAGELRVHALGWESGEIATLVQNAEHAIEAEPGGLVHVYTSRTYIERKRTSGRRLKEEVQSRFLIEAVGETHQPRAARFRPYVIDVLRGMTVEHSLLETHDGIRAGELAGYLALARSLGLLDIEPERYAARVWEECGGDLGSVTCSYRVQFDSGAVASAFRFSGATLEQLARTAVREFMLRKYAGMKVTDWLPAVGFAYASRQAYEWYRRGELQARLKTVSLPSWFTGGKGPRTENLTSNMVVQVERLFRLEDTFIQALLRLDRSVDSSRRGEPVGFEALNGALRALLGSAQDLNEYDDSAFFALLDRLIEIGSNGKARRNSALLLEVSPKTGKLAGQTVTKVLMAGSDAPGEITKNLVVDKQAAGGRR